MRGTITIIQWNEGNLEGMASLDVNGFTFNQRFNGWEAPVMEKLVELKVAMEAELNDKLGIETEEGKAAETTSWPTE